MRLFISYSTGDLEIVKQIAEALHPYAQVYYWDRDKVPGDDAWHTIFSWIDSADLVICVITDKTISRAMAVGNEIGRAQAKGKKIIPVKSKDVESSELGSLYGITFTPLEQREFKETLCKIVESHINIDQSKAEKAWIIRFRKERLEIINNPEEDIPIHLTQGVLSILQLIPKQAVSSDKELDFNLLLEKWRYISPLSCTGQNGMYPNMDGFYTLDYDKDPSQCHSYVQVFRNGIIETATTKMVEWQEGKLPSIAFEKDLIDVLTQYIEHFKEVNLCPPAYLLFSLHNAKGLRLTNSYSNQIDREELIFDPIVIDDFDKPSHEVLHPLFDRVWQAFGFPYSMNFDINGNWKGR